MQIIIIGDLTMVDKSTGVVEPKKQDVVVDRKVVSPKTSGDDNVLAALSHALILVFPIIAPLLIWILYKDKSPYVKDQSMQALAYQLVATALSFLGVIMMTVLSVVSFGILGILFFPIFFIFALAILAYGLFGAYKAYNGEQFKYVLIGDLVPKN